MTTRKQIKRFFIWKGDDEINQFLERVPYLSTEIIVLEDGSIIIIYEENIQEKDIYSTEVGK